ncbi:MAG: hypothetical protein FJW39_29975 [Acidobacteria bacterium]|nr:hypothetical protein [Acidobacteriota bacterium]
MKETDQPGNGKTPCCAKNTARISACEFSKTQIGPCTLTLKLRETAQERTITYLKEARWSQDTLLLGANGLAALTFCDVEIAAHR